MSSDSESEYQDATEDFLPTIMSREKDEKVAEVLTAPIAPPRRKKEMRKKAAMSQTNVLETQRQPSDSEPSTPLPSVSSSSDKVPPIVNTPDNPKETELPGCKTLKNGSVSQEQALPTVAIKDDGLLLNLELLQSSEVTVSSETHLKASGRAERDEGINSFVISSEGESGDEDVTKLENEDEQTRKSDQCEGEGGEVPQKEQKGEPGTGGNPGDTQILENVMIKNLETGEVIPLSQAEQIIPKGTDPVSFHILKMTSQISHSPMTQYSAHEDSPGVKPKKSKFGKRITKFMKRNPKGKQKTKLRGTPQDPAEAGSYSEDDSPEGVEQVKYRPASSHKGPFEFEEVRLKQELNGELRHMDAVWTMKFSICGRLLATGGQDSNVRVWVMKSAYPFFHDLQLRYARVGASADSLSSRSTSSSLTSQDSNAVEEDPAKPFRERPLCVYSGHQADVLDLSWSKNFFLLSSSMDKTVRLWHISRKECLCCFQHSEFVTSISFHPRDDRYFMSGSLDGKVRLWNIPDKRVALWNEIEGVGSKLITAANFCSNGKLIVVGTYDGRCLFYDTEQLKYHTQIQVRSRHGKNAKGRKISGVEPLPGEEKLLVSSNDSRIRLYNLKDHSLTCKYKGCINNSSQIRATFNHDAQYIICGSEDNNIYIWSTYGSGKLPSGRRDRNEQFESFTAHSSVVTTAVFAPIPGLFANAGLTEVGEVIVAADYQGEIKIYVSGAEL